MPHGTPPNPLPRTADRTRTQRLTGGATAAVLIALTAAGIVHLRLRTIEARSLSMWERDWERVEPGWSGQLPTQSGVDDANPLLLAGIAFELVFTAALVYVPPLRGLFGTAALPLDVVALIAVFPVLVWGTDELRRLRRRTRKPART
ncbi:cation transporting ATPase C-terminal domain-containing protein [Streptomyces sp. NPDC058401]|uniref:cation transporting ATPase C-terminal domain-containing protein n=1 Tax=Streptomyces sp. NPDC058401 TaxID=3346480 RepID=UPI003666A138